MTRRTSITLTRRYRQLQPLFTQGELCKGSFVVLRGKVAQSTRLLGREVQVNCAKTGAVLGLPETIGGGPYQTTAVAAAPVTVHFIPTADVLSMIQDDSAIGMRVIEMLGGDLTNLYEQIRKVSYRHQPRGANQSSSANIRVAPPA
jgi:CRP-like cAMP-binding protein